MLRFLSSGQNNHPLADAKELKRVLGELSGVDDLRAIDEISEWFESLRHADNIRPDQLFEAVRLLDEAGQGHLRRVTREYLTAPRTIRVDEKRSWNRCCDYWQHCAAIYGTLCAAGTQKDKIGSVLKPHLPLLFARYVAAMSSVGKWRHFHYERLPATFWLQLGAAYLSAERAGVSDSLVYVYPFHSIMTTTALEYTRFLALEASSLDSLLPIEIELAEKLIAHFAPHFVLNVADRRDNLYWVDAAQGVPPQRLIKSLTPAPSIRLLAFGDAPEELASLTRRVEGGEVPADLALGGQYSPKLVLSVLRHLAAYWAPQPPVRQHQRHPVKSRLFALNGFERCLGVLNGQASEMEGQAEAWIVENVSLGGFGAVLLNIRRDAMKLGELVALQPDGGNNWLISIVRRYERDDEVQSVGIETLSKNASLIHMRLHGGSHFGAGSEEPAILLDSALGVDEVRVVLPAMTYDPRESYDSEVDGKAVLLSPISLILSGRDYEIASYRLRYPEKG